MMDLDENPQDTASNDMNDFPDHEGEPATLNFTPGHATTNPTDPPLPDEVLHIKPISGLYENWFLEYASYVILERAVPYVYDGLKPVQRRILHAMKRLEDGRYNKVANIIGFTMQYHPHGDASIGEALVGLGQKDLLVDTQGNWGNIYTGDGAAAPRYIEARLSKFALEVVFNAKTTQWKLSYDGRNNEPVNLPVKFPLVLAQGVEGIAVGLASKILPHNFNELIDACIAHLKNQPFQLFPDFPTGGMADCSRYNDGLQGGKIRVRARISQLDKKTLVITEVPYGKTTSSLIDSILAIAEKGKLKIKKIDDNTAENVEILVHLPPGVSPDQTIDGLYALTDCEVSISPNCCVIEDGKPKFMAVSDILKVSVENTVNLLKRELEIRLDELEEAWQRSSLEKIFIENRIYNHIEECETWESIIETIDQGLEPFKKYLHREVTTDDIVRLTEIKIKRISKYDAFKAEEYIQSVEDEIEVIENNLENLIKYAIDYYENIKSKYGEGRKRKTEVREFDVIEATKVVAANEKLYVNRKEGFVGTGLRKDEFVSECSDIDDVIVFLRDGRYLVTKVSDKAFVGKDIIYVGIFKKNDERTIYNVVYMDGRDGVSYVKRFAVVGVTRDREYDVTRGTKNSRVLYITANPNGEAETVKVLLKPKAHLKKSQFEFNFSSQSIKGRGSQGNILTRHAVFRVSLKESGVSTLGARKIWFDSGVMRLNDDARGQYLGEFSDDDRVISMTQSGMFKIDTFDLSTHFDADVILVEKYEPGRVYSVVYFEGEQEFYYVKRFQVEVIEKRVRFIGDHPGSRLVVVSSDKYPQVKLTFTGRKRGQAEIVELRDFIAVKGYKARGKRLSTSPVDTVTLLEPLPVEENLLRAETEVPAETELARPGESGNEEMVMEIPDEPRIEEEVIEKKEEKDKKKKDQKVKNGKQRSLFSLD